MYENTRVADANYFVLQPIVKRFVVCIQMRFIYLRKYVLHFRFYSARAGPFVRHDYCWSNRLCIYIYTYICTYIIYVRHYVYGTSSSARRPSMMHHGNVIHARIIEGIYRDLQKAYVAAV